MSKNTWYYMKNDETRKAIWGMPLYGCVKLPSKGAARWKWSSGEYCY